MGIPHSEVIIECDSRHVCFETITIPLEPIRASTQYRDLRCEIVRHGWTIEGSDTFCPKCSGGSAETYC